MLPIHLLQPVYAAREADSITNIIDILGRAFNVIMLSAGVVFVGFVILAVIKFATAEGDPKAVQGAKLSLTYAIMGLVVIVSVFAINAIVINALGVDSYSHDLKNPNSLLDMMKGAIESLMDYANIDFGSSGIPAMPPLPPAH